MAKYFALEFPLSMLSDFPCDVHINKLDISEESDDDELYDYCKDEFESSECLVSDEQKQRLSLLEAVFDIKIASTEKNISTIELCPGDTLYICLISNFSIKDNDSAEFQFFDVSIKEEIPIA